MKITRKTRKLKKALSKHTNKSKNIKKYLNNIKSKLHFSEEFCNKLVMTSPDSVVLIDTKSKIIYVSERTVEMCGCKSSDDLIGKNAFDFFASEDRQRATFNLQKTFGEGFVGKTQYTMLKSNGEKYLAELNATVIKDIKGTPMAVMATIRDMTESKKKDEKVKTSEEKYETLFNSANDSIFVHEITKDLQPGRFIEANEISYKRLGYTREEFLKLGPFDIIPQGNMQKTLWAWEKIFKEKSAVFETEAKTKNGNMIPIEVNAHLIEKNGGLQLLVIARDITQRKRDEEILRISESNYRSIFNGMDDSVVLLDIETKKVIDMNEAAVEKLSIANKEIKNFNIKDFGSAEPPYSKQDVMKWIEKTINEGPQLFEWKRIDSKGDIMWMEVSLRKTVINNRECLLAINRNINARKKAEDESKQSYKMIEKILDGVIQTMENLVEKKDIYTVGHQRRTAEVATLIALDMGFSESRANGVYTAARIHDIGKIFVPGNILNKVEPLTGEEFGQIKMHAQAGYEILKAIDFPWPIAQMIRQHHERMDGSGYPLGLKGEDILIEARIIAVADVVEAITFERPYRAAFGLNIALNELKKNRGRLYDEKVVDACLKIFEENKFVFKK